jgi:peptide/nickel transport system substrate-binding protein
MQGREETMHHDTTGPVSRRAALMLLAGAPALAQTPRPTTFTEPPALRERVARGELPPVVSRIPQNPMVVTPLDQVGRYGGTWRNLLVGGGALSQLFRFQAYESLTRWTPDWSGVMPNIAESVETDARATEYLFRLRRGMRWSDGTPFTADDILFWYRDIYSLGDVMPSRPTWMGAGGRPLLVEKVDDATVLFRFAAPNGLFLQWLAAAPAGINYPTNFPRHFLQQFHAAYNPDADRLARQRGFGGWIALLQERAGINIVDGMFKASDMPVLHPWRFTVAAGESTSQLVAERNPYYWKVDTRGNQLPYIDRVTYDLLGDAQVALLKTMNGEVDFIDQYIATPANKAVLADNQRRGAYSFYSLRPTLANLCVLQFNLNHPDAAKRAVFGRKEFRIAVSHAINREEIVDVVFYGTARPWQAAPREGVFYNERLAKQYLAHDPAAANRMLDAMGLSRRDSAGFRLLPNGQRLTLAFEVDASQKPLTDTIELVVRALGTVGISAQLRASDRALWEQRVRHGDQFDVAVHSFGGGDGLAVILDPRYYFPHTRNSMYAKRWVEWYLNRAAAEGEEPPPATRRQMELYNELSATADQEKQRALMHQILEIAADEFYVIGIAAEDDGYGVVRDRMRNVPRSMPNSYVYPHPGPANPEQFFLAS